MGIIVLALMIAVVIILITNSLRGGATHIISTEFVMGVENSRFIKEDGTFNDGRVLDEDGNVKIDENGNPIVMTIKALAEKGYKLKDATPVFKDATATDPLPNVNDAYANGDVNGYLKEGFKFKDARVVDKDGKAAIVIWKVCADGYQLTGYAQKDGRALYYTFMPSSYSSLESLQTIKGWGASDIAVDWANPNANSWVSTLFTVLSLVAVCVVFFFIIRSTMGGSGKIMSFAKSKARVSTNIKVRFTDVAGAEEEKVELAEIVEFLRHPKKFSVLGASIPKGVLLVGPPGTGKTLFAKAVAGEAGVPFFSVSGSDFVEMYVGVGASRVRDLFEMAKKNQPCIIFIDEIDAVGRHRGAGLGGGNDEREQTLNQILVQMDGFESNEGVIVMAATNRADILDPALMRPGRFDRQIFVNLPDVKGREQILKVHARNKPISPDVNFKTIARITAGFSGADLANLLNEAAILAARADKKFIGNVELYEGVNKVLMGPQKKSRVVTESDKRITAYHESGHAIVAKLCENCDPVQEVSIIPRGNAAGYTMTRPDNDDAHMTKNKICDLICMDLG